jgi:predicted nucleic acid-binding protein
MAGVIVLDACVVIAHLDAADAHHARASALLTNLAGQAKTMNVLTRAEVLVIPARSGRRRAVEDILDQLRIRSTELPATAAGQLAEMRAHTGLRMPDCCVLLTAELAGGPGPAGLATFDDRLARAATARGITVRDH